MLRPGGKLDINIAMMPIPQDVTPGEVRCLQNIPGDIDQRIRRRGRLVLQDRFLWIKQTSKLRMWPRWPGNVLVCNTVEETRECAIPETLPLPTDVSLSIRWP